MAINLTGLNPLRHLSCVSTVQAHAMVNPNWHRSTWGLLSFSFSLSVAFLSSLSMSLSVHIFPYPILSLFLPHINTPSLALIYLHTHVLRRSLPPTDRCALCPLSLLTLPLFTQRLHSIFKCYALGKLMDENKQYILLDFIQGTFTRA